MELVGVTVLYKVHPFSPTYTIARCCTHLSSQLGAWAFLYKGQLAGSFSRLQFDQYVAGANGTLRELNASPVVGLEDGSKEIQRRCCFCFVSFFFTCNALLYQGVSSSFLYSLSNSDWTGRVVLHHRHPILFCYFYMRTYPGNSSLEDIQALTNSP